MRIVQARVRNYKSIFDTGELRFQSGFNVIVGQNNAGKTALLEALSLQGGNNPHRSLRTLPSPHGRIAESSSVEMKYEFEPGELLELFADRLPRFYVPWPAQMADPFSAFKEAVSGPNRFTLGSGGSSRAYLDAFDVPAGGTVFRVDATRNENGVHLECDRKAYSGSTSQLLLHSQLKQIVQQRMYAFRAERLNVGVSPFGPDTELQPDARNLPAVLNHLQANFSRFNKFNDYVRTVFPQVQRVSVHPLDERLEIRVWNVDPSTEREDLTVPLAQSGTGIGQVLAILYVVLTANQPRTVLIDEPQSFLHPGAVRKLMDLLKRHPEHQFLITSHSPAVITASNPSTLTLVQKHEEETRYTQVAASEAANLRIILAEVGARLGDVFGADNVLWVEGRTEELCFPLIFEQVARRQLLGTQILGVVQTGDFEARNPRTTFTVYERLSAGRALLPPAIGFVFDREERTERQREDLVRESGGAVTFLPRRMYENYLLSPAAIADVAGQIKGFCDPALTDARVAEWMREHRWDRKYFGKTVREEDRNTDTWLTLVHGAAVLKDVFNQCSEGRVAYDKVQHGLLLTQWLIDNDPVVFKEIADLLVELIPDESH